MLRIRSKDLDDIVSHCRREAPVEACGILGGRVTKADGAIIRDVLRVYMCRNELDSPTEYRIGGEEQIQAFTDIERSGMELLGFYHSHPQGDARPSPIDRERGNYIGYSYVIVSLSPTRVSSWVLGQEGFMEEEVQVIPDESQDNEQRN